MSQDQQPAKLKVTVKLHPATPNSQLHAVGMPRKRGWPFAKMLLWLLLAVGCYIGWQMWRGVLPVANSSPIPAPMVHDVAQITAGHAAAADAKLVPAAQNSVQNTSHNDTNTALQNSANNTLAGTAVANHTKGSVAIEAEPVVPVAPSAEQQAAASSPVQLGNSSPHTTDANWPAGFSRLVLTADLEQLEPGAPLTDLVLAANVQRLYLFTELSGYAGQELRHRWYYQNKLQTEVVLTIEDSPWRTYSEKWLLEGQLGQWRVEIVDQAQNVLYQRNFSYQ